MALNISTGNRMNEGAFYLLVSFDSYNTSVMFLKVFNGSVFESSFLPRRRGSCTKSNVKLPFFLLKNDFEASSEINKF